MTKILIVGAGFGGIAAARALIHQGERDFLIVDEQAGLGGVWFQNRYPGCASDMPAHLFCFRDKPMQSGSRLVPSRAHVLDYLKSCLREAGLEHTLKLGKKVADARWRADSASWTVTLCDGSDYQPRFLILATGTSGTVHYPEIPGLAETKVRCIHATNWPSEGVDVSGLRVAVIGSGASAVQIIPWLAEHAATVTVHQRTARWVLPGVNMAVPKVLRAIDRANWWRRSTGRLIESYVDRRAVRTMFANTDQLMEWNREYKDLMRKSIGDEALAAQTLPMADFGCSRTLFSRDYFRALRQRHVSLCPQPAAVESDAVIDTMGQRHPTDLIVLATGYSRFERSLQVFGLQGKSLYAHWREDPRALAGVLAPGFPNLVHMSGPNSGILNSAPRVLETQARFAADLIRLTSADKSNSVFGTNLQQLEDFNKPISEKLANTIWAGDHCSAWYTSVHRANPVLWPGSLDQYRRTLKTYPIHALVGQDF